MIILYLETKTLVDTLKKCLNLLILLYFLLCEIDDFFARCGSEVWRSIEGCSSPPESNSLIEG